MADRTEIFVYGTLRPGAAEWASPGYTADPEAAVVLGTLYDYGPFPYLSLTGDTIIKGAILHLDETMADHVWHVEIGAGYKQSTVTATLSDGTTREVVTYEVDARHLSDISTRYPVVEDGDWLASYQKRRDEMEARWAARHG